MLYTTKRPSPSPPKGSHSLLISHPSYFTLYPQLVHLRDADPLDVMAVEQQAIHSGFFFKALIFFHFIYISSLSSPLNRSQAALMASSQPHLPLQNKIKCCSHLQIVLIYKASVRSLFIFASLAETLRSIVRSPISTTSPPRISELT